MRTTCFVSPIFPGITDVPAIIERVKGDCNLIWLENLNLRGTFKPVILNYIRKKRLDLVPLYEDIYLQGSRGYWQALDEELRAYAEASGLPYVTNDDPMSRPFNAPPVVVNFFYHSEIKRSAREKQRAR